MKSNNLETPISEIVFQGFSKEFLVYQRMADTASVSKQAHKKDLLLLGVVCALRGSKINKIIQSAGSTRRLKDVLSGLRGIYGITDGRPSSPTAATLPRFLPVTAPHEDGGRQITLPLSPAEVASDYPLEFCMSHAGALLPATASASDTLTKAVAYSQYLMTLKFGEKATKGQVLQFVLIAAKSNLWSTEEKIAPLNKIKILQGNAIAPPYKTSVEEASIKFELLS